MTQDNSNNNNLNMGSSANSNQNMNMIIPGRSLQAKTLSKTAIKTSLQTFTGLALGFGALNDDIGFLQANTTPSLHSVLCSAIGNVDSERLEVRDGKFKKFKVSTNLQD